MGSATKVGITKINSIEKTWVAVNCLVARFKIGETTKWKARNFTKTHCNASFAFWSQAKRYFWLWSLWFGFADFLLVCFGLLFFRLGLFTAPWNSINSEKISVFYLFRFMPAQLTRFGIDRISAILTIAWRVVLFSKFSLLQGIIFFFPARLFCLVVVRSRN